MAGRITDVEKRAEVAGEKERTEQREAATGLLRKRAATGLALAIVRYAMRAVVVVVVVTVMTAVVVVKGGGGCGGGGGEADVYYGSRDSEGSYRAAVGLFTALGCSVGTESKLMALPSLPK